MLLQSFGLRNLPENQAYPFNLEIVKNLESIKLESNITFFVGENGSGKSTILEALAYASGVPVAGGTPFQDDPLMQSAIDLGKMLSLRFQEKTHMGFFTRAEDFIGFVKNVLRQIAELDAEIKDIKDNWTGGDINYAIGPLIKERKEITDRYSENLDGMSHGEGFLKFFMARITGKGLYLIDEPEAALSPQRQLSLMAIIHEAVKNKGSQFIIATHSPIIMAMPDTQILYFSEGKIENKTYAETEHFQFTQSFLSNPEVYFQHLINPPLQ